MYETIDLLQQTTDYYYIDYIPYNTDDPNFLELEEYFEKHYLSSFSEKITKIILKIIYYYPCKVYLTEPTKDIPLTLLWILIVISAIIHLLNFPK